MTMPTMEESQSFLCRWDQGGEPGRYDTQKHLRARIDGEAAARAALRKIAAMETPSANATVRKMAEIARAAITPEDDA